MTDAREEIESLRQVIYNGDLGIKHKKEIHSIAQNCKTDEAKKYAIEMIGQQTHELLNSIDQGYESIINDTNHWLETNNEHYAQNALESFMCICSQARQILGSSDLMDLISDVRPLKLFASYRPHQHSPRFLASNFLQESYGNVLPMHLYESWDVKVQYAAIFTDTQVTRALAGTPLTNFSLIEPRTQTTYLIISRLERAFEPSISRKAKVHPKIIDHLMKKSLR